MGNDVTDMRTYSIAIDPAAREDLQAKLGALAKQYGHVSSVKKDADLLPSNIESRVQEILKDWKLHRLEAPHLFRHVARIVGAKRMVDRADVTAIVDVVRKDIVERIATEEKAAPTNGVRKNPMQAGAEILAGFVAHYTSSFDGLINHLALTEDMLTWLQASVHREMSYQRLRHVSPRMGLSWRNWFGAWAIFTDAPPTMRQLDGLRCFDSTLHSHLLGLQVFRTGLQTGYFVEQAPTIQEFLTGPFGTFAHVETHLRESDTTTPTSSMDRYPACRERVIALAEQCGASEWANLFGAITPATIEDDHD